jgi:hypothetical protein
MHDAQNVVALGPDAGLALMISGWVGGIKW